MNNLTTGITVLRLLVPLLYLFVAGAFLSLFFSQKERPVPAWAFKIRIAAISLHFFMWILLFLQRGRFPFATAFEGLFFCSLLLAFFCLIFEHNRERLVYGAFLWPVNLIIISTSALFLEKGTPFSESMMSAQFILHMLLIFGAYACFSFSFVVSAMYFMQHRQIKNKKIGPFFRKLPSLEEMDRTVFRADSTGLVMFLTGMSIGYFFLPSIGGETSIVIRAGLALFAASAYLLEHILRLTRGWQGKRTCILSILGFGFVVITMMVGRHGL